MNRQLCCVILLLSLPLLSTAQAADWRTTASDKQKLKNVVKVLPGASTIMLQMGERYRSLYWAGVQEKWQFAEYQIEEMQGLIKTLMITRPKRAATAKQFLDKAFGDFPLAIREKHWGSFSLAFERMRQHCMKCHTNKEKFCDECHTYAAVKPYCWDCHIQPKEAN